MSPRSSAQTPRRCRTVFDRHSWSPAELEVIHAQSGQSVTLPCRAPGADPQADIRWSKHDLEPEEVVLIEGGVVQHPTIRDRVTVGHLSITLKNVVLEDSGTYRCRVVRRPAARRRRSGPDRDHVTSVYLSVSPAGEPPQVLLGEGLKPVR